MVSSARSAASAATPAIRVTIFLAGIALSHPAAKVHNDPLWLWLRVHANEGRADPVHVAEPGGRCLPRYSFDGTPKTLGPHHERLHALPERNYLPHQRDV